MLSVHNMAIKYIKSNKKFLILLAAATAFILSVLLIKRLPKQIPKVQPIQSTAEEKIEISGVKTANFLKNRSENNTSSYTTLAKTKDYHLFFILKEELFIVSITSYPFDSFRSIAEQEFLKKLGISQEEACKLNVDITTPMSANPDKAGKNYELSWCEQNF